MNVCFLVFHLLQRSTETNRKSGPLSDENCCYVNKALNLIRVLPIFLFIEALRVCLAEVDDIDVCAVDSAHVAHAWVNLHRHSSVDPCDCHSVSGVHRVHQIVVSEQHYSVRRLSSRHVVCKHRTVMLQLVFTVRFAKYNMVDFLGLLDTALLKIQLKSLSFNILQKNKGLIF